MLFNTIDFVVFFIILLTTVVAIKHRKFQHLILLGGSYYFFYFSSNYLIVLLIFSTILDFYLAKIIYNTENVFRKKLLLIISLGGNLGLLGFFKYSDFTILQFNLLGNYFRTNNVDIAINPQFNNRFETDMRGYFRIKLIPGKVLWKALKTYFKLKK